nr:MAG TPA: hypothetical protein [Caudoviricetes sp.]
MLDHMIFSKLKWFNIPDNADSVFMNGKTWSSHPKTVTIADGTEIYGLTDKYSNSGGSYTIKTDGTWTLTCVGESNGYYAVTGKCNQRMPFTDDDKSTNVYLGVVKDVISENWGGKNLLIRLCQAFKALTGKAVSVC